MSSGNAKGKGKGGRPPRAPGEKLQRTNLTLRPSLLRGLELLAKAQHRSLSQAVEWAVQVGLNSYKVNEDSTMGDVLLAVEAESAELAKFMAIYRMASTLLDFEDAVACEAIQLSSDKSELYRSAPPQVSLTDSFQDDRNEIDRLYERVLSPHWESIREMANEYSSKGKRLEGVSFVHALGLYPEWRGESMWDVYTHLDQQQPAGEVFAESVIKRPAKKGQPAIK
ncbi:hypothetical protein [Pseudoxanthomonas sp. JBR18]|uniref:hypothetical protein n=1 Tax=Pseudoxanthomonas sp. JBR18 TaxID=2969308 RepID=UPI002306108C|nr:hypothetical protein [Pseudoxanthomonas sp. JBR18]WCE03159.1 hypothetical protein PJ250_13670 [Pseudoxanthomonas sp. JBR18]